jgi:hypothetical protein
VIRVQVRDDDRIDVDVIDDGSQLREHAVAAIEQQRGVVLLDQVPATSPSGVLP